MIQRERPRAEKSECEQCSIPSAKYDIARHGFIELSNHLDMIGEPVCN